MKKACIALLMVFLFVLSALPVGAVEASCEVHLIADRKEASVGDTVHYTVVARGEDVVAMQFDVAVPQGMSYVADSAAVPKQLKSNLGVAATGWTEKTMRFSFYNDAGVQIPEGTILMGFDCVIESEGMHQVSLIDVAPYDSNFVGIKAALQFDTVAVGEVSGEDIPQIQPMPPETGTETVPGVEVVPGVTEGSGSSSGSVGGSEAVDGDSIPSDSIIDTGEGNTGSVPGNSGSSVEGSEGDPSGNSGSSIEGSAGGPAGSSGSVGDSGNAAPPDSSTSSDGSVSSGNESSTLPESGEQTEPQPPDAVVTNPQDGNPDQETGFTDQTPVQQPGDDVIINAEDTLQQPGNETAPLESEEDRDYHLENPPEVTRDEVDTEATRNEGGEAPSVQQDVDDENDGQSTLWLWIVLAVVGLLAIAVVAFLIVKKKR